MSKKVFAYIWEYIVKEECLEEFKRTYGPEGDWVRLFRRADGYIATNLHQDISDPKRFVTIDFWHTKEDRDDFRNKFSKEFEDLDEYCESLTIQEKLIGDFDSHIKPISG